MTRPNLAQLEQGGCFARGDADPATTITPAALTCDYFFGLVRLELGIDLGSVPQVRPFCGR